MVTVFAVISLGVSVSSVCIGVFTERRIAAAPTVVVMERSARIGNESVDSSSLADGEATRSL